MFRVAAGEEPGLAGVPRHPAVDAGEGAGGAADCRGEDAAHCAGHGQAGADVAERLAVDAASPSPTAALVDGVAVFGPQRLTHLH